MVFPLEIRIKAKNSAAPTPGNPSSAGHSFRAYFSAGFPRLCVDAQSNKLLNQQKFLKNQLRDLVKGVDEVSSDTHIYVEINSA